MSSLCGLWLLFLGLAVPFAIYAIAALVGALRRSPGDGSELDDPQLLFMTPACVRALGRCARLERLSKLSPKWIGKRLRRARFPDGEEPPSEWQYSSWPLQASLILAAKWHELRALQSELVDRSGQVTQRDAVDDELPFHEEALRKLGRRVVLLPAALALILLILSLVAWRAAAASDQCKCSGGGPITDITVIPPPPSARFETVELSTDMIFDYDRPKAGEEGWRSSFHEANAINQLRNLFSGFGGIVIKSISAHTDPIGGKQKNEILGSRRATEVARLIDKIKTEQRSDISFLGQPSAVSNVTTSGPTPHDSDFWKFCFGKYYLSQPLARPLQDLDARFNDDRRMPCHLAKADTIYPACARIDVPKPNRRPSVGYAQAAENLRELTECLAPMRHVAITFSYQRLLPPTQH
ncbi:hypothetical protein [Sphingomonas sp. TREG-RG-20F-R18-01]|uniref:hypothetical protein n=1 Tax=Sphingomonas sp. TREG-RG-20F-R18-01 TaxID=2914982 RepID=UPI001F55E0A5|nr:hypothetical protein [Sphingomonas sp. TREG-RG-20F-R18-01]